MIRRPPRATQSRSAAASDVYKRQPVGSYAKSPASDRVMVEDITSWHAVCLRRVERELKLVTSISGSTPQEFWRGLERQMHRPGTTWIVSYQCSRSWALLGLWDMLERGECRIAGGDYRSQLKAMQSGLATSPGLLVIEDPPNLVQFAIGNQPRRCLWIDSRNWGIDIDPIYPRGTAACNFWPSCYAISTRMLNATPDAACVRRRQAGRGEAFEPMSRHGRFF